MASRRPWMRSPLYALFTSGRLSVTVATPRASSVHSTGPVAFERLIGSSTTVGRRAHASRAATDWQEFADTIAGAGASVREGTPVMVLATSAWRAERNDKARARRMRPLPDIFPPAVLAHALRKPFVPPTPRRAIESYWRHHPVRADKLARALAAISGTPAGWVWRIAGRETPGAAPGFRAPPAPLRERAHAKGPGYCCVCGQPVFRFGWHRDLWHDKRPNRNASWHSCC